jgi:hypothetical protein
MRVLRLGEDRFGRTLLDNLAPVHDQHPAAEMPHDREIVRDEKHGELELIAQAKEELQQLRLN